MPPRVQVGSSELEPEGVLSAVLTGATEVPHGPGGAPAFLGRLDTVVAFATELAAAALVVTEIGILGAGVFWRYVLDNPLAWSDELASMLFLWLISLGAVIALRRGEHMRMTVVVRRLPPGLQRFLGHAAALVVVVFTMVVLIPGVGYMEQQQAITTPTLQIPGSWEIAGELLAFALLLYTALRQFLTGIAPREFASLAAVTAALAVALWQLEPWFEDIGNADLLIFFVGFVGLSILSGVPIAFAFGISTIGYLFYASTVPLSIVVSQMNQGMSAIELLAVPMFVVLGLLLEMTGIARAMVDFLAALVGRRRGGLSYVLIGAMYLISGISGSKAADQAAVAPILLPEMKRRGAHPGELVAQLASSAAMSETIPPSLVLIIVGAVTGVSTAALFHGGLLPAGVGALALIIAIFFRTRHEQPMGEPAKTRDITRKFLIAVPALILPFLIRYFVLAGITTATEVAVIGIIYSVVAGLVVYRCFDWKRVFPILVETAALSGAILLIIGSASVMAWALTQAGFAQSLADLMASLPGGKASYMGISIVLFIVLGSVLEGLPAMVLFGPLLFPIAQNLGINEIQYAIVAILAMGIGLFSPPFGVGFYQSCLIGRAETEQALGRVIPYMAALVVALIIVALFPWLST